MNDNYKKQHKPNLNENSKFHQSYFIPKNPEKCMTKVNICRSSWETAFCRYLDDNPNVTAWASEPIAVKYRNPIANLEFCYKNHMDPNNPMNWKICNYYTDFWMEMKQDDGSVQKIFVEIKPYAQTQPPKPLKPNATMKEHKAYNIAAQTYLINKAKWDAAAQTFGEKGCKFMVITEVTLKKLGLI